MLPPTIQSIVELIGHAKAMALVSEFGGQEIKFPRTEASDTFHALVEVIGLPATRKLGAALNAEGYIYIAMCTRPLKLERNRNLIKRYDQLLAEGHSGRGAVSILVREFRPINCRQVERIVNAPMPEAQPIKHLQGQLF